MVVLDYVVVQTLEVTLLQNDLEQVDNIDLHSVVLVLYHMVESVDQRTHDVVRNLVGLVCVLLNLLEEQLHELTGRGVHSEHLGVVDLAFSLLSLDEAQRDLHKDVHIV